MAEEKKLGPNVTYMNPDKGAKLVTVGGVLFKEGEAVNLEEKLGKERAAPILKKLAGNQFFKVDGGPDHGKKEGGEQPMVSDDATARMAIAQEQKIRREQGDEAADAYVASLDESGQVKYQGGQGQQKGQQNAAAKKAEEDYKGPEKPTLENEPPPRRRP